MNLMEMLFSQCEEFIKSLTYFTNFEKQLEQDEIQVFHDDIHNNPS